MPATCATAIRGIARKLRPRPAKVTRENVSAPIGKSNASTATDAANIAKADRPRPANHETAAPFLPPAFQLSPHESKCLPSAVNASRSGTPLCEGN